MAFRHLDFFEMVRNEDEKELARKFEKVWEALLKISERVIVDNTVLT